MVSLIVLENKVDLWSFNYRLVNSEDVKYSNCRKRINSGQGSAL
jgi:hypothetical protein